MHPWFLYETAIAAACAALLWVLLLSLWLSFRFRARTGGGAMKVHLTLLLLGTLCLVCNSVRSADLSCVYGVLPCPAMKGLIDTSTGFLLDALTVGSLAYMRSLQALQMHQQRSLIPRAPTRILGALLLAFHLFSIIVAGIEAQLLTQAGSEPALVRALTSKYLALDILICVLLTFIVLVCGRLRRGLLQHLRTLTAVSVTTNTHTNSKQKREAAAAAGKIKASSKAPAPPVNPAAAVTAHSAVHPDVPSVPGGEPRLAFAAPPPPGASATGARVPPPRLSDRDLHPRPHPRAVVLQVTVQGSSQRPSHGSAGTLPEEDVATPVTLMELPTPPPALPSVVDAAESRVRALSLAVRKLTLAVCLVVLVCVVGVATSFQTMISGLRGDAGPLRPLIYKPDGSSYSERRLLVYLTQCVGLLIICWYCWLSPRRWMESLCGRRFRFAGDSSSGSVSDSPLPFWSTCLHGVPLTAGVDGPLHRDRDRDAVELMHKVKPPTHMHKPLLSDAGVPLPPESPDADAAAAAAPGAAVFFHDPRGFAPPAAAAARDGTALRDRGAHAPLDSMASYAPTGLSMRSGVTSIKAQQLHSSVVPVYDGASLLMGAVVPHLQHQTACDCAPGHCYCAPEMDDAADDEPEPEHD